MFSFPGCLALGDDSQYKMKFAKKDADGKVPTEHRNILVHPTKTGYIDSELFSGPGYVTVGVAYKDPKSLLR